MTVENTRSENVFQAFIQRLAVKPDDRFCLFVKRGQEVDLSNRAVFASACQIGSWLLRKNAAKGSVVTIVLDHSVFLYAAFIGCVIHGFIPTFLPPLTFKQDPKIFNDSMQKLFDRIRPGAVITSLDAASGVPADRVPTCVVDEFPDSSAADEIDLRLQHLSSDGVAFLQHSSGTTGQKKGVMLTHAQVTEQMHLYAAAIGATEGDTFVSWLPLYHDMGLITSFLLPAIFGCPIVSLDALEWVRRPQMLLEYIEKTSAQFTWLPNFAFHHLARGAGSRTWDLSSLKLMTNCSEPCRGAAFDVFLKSFEAAGIDAAKLRVCYAMAENVFAVTQSPPGRPARPGRSKATTGYLSSGVPLPGVSIEIVDTEGNAVPDGQLGEIRISTTCLFDGYYRLPEITAERLNGIWYSTRDLGCIEDGELFVTGRVDDLLIVNGKNLMAHELEYAITELPGIAPGRVIVGAEYDQASGAEKLFVLAEPDGSVTDLKQLQSKVGNSVLSLCGIFPAEVRFLPRGFLVKSTSGKLARRQSFEKFRATPPGDPERPLALLSGESR